MKNQKTISTILIIGLAISFFTFLCIAITYKDKYNSVNDAYKSCVEYQDKKQSEEKKKQAECKSLVIYRYNNDIVTDVYKLHNIIAYNIKDKTLVVKGLSNKLTLQGTFTVIECKKNSKAWSRAVEYHKDTDGHDYAYYFNKRHDKDLPETDVSFSDL